MCGIEFISYLCFLPNCFRGFWNGRNSPGSKPKGSRARRILRFWAPRLAAPGTRKPRFSLLKREGTPEFSIKNMGSNLVFPHYPDRVLDTVRYCSDEIRFWGLYSLAAWPLDWGGCCWPTTWKKMGLGSHHLSLICAQWKTITGMFFGR